LAAIGVDAKQVTEHTRNEHMVRNNLTWDQVLATFFLIYLEVETVAPLI